MVRFTGKYTGITESKYMMQLHIHPQNIHKQRGKWHLNYAAISPRTIIYLRLTVYVKEANGGYAHRMDKTSQEVCQWFFALTCLFVSFVSIWQCIFLSYIFSWITSLAQSLICFSGNYHENYEYISIFNPLRDTDIIKSSHDILQFILIVVQKIYRWHIWLKIIILCECTMWPVIWLELNHYDVEPIPLTSSGYGQKWMSGNRQIHLFSKAIGFFFKTTERIWALIYIFCHLLTSQFWGNFVIALRLSDCVKQGMFEKQAAKLRPSCHIQM